eukprot:5324805-Pleurochrysis_carterae.AAC.1
MMCLRAAEQQAPSKSSHCNLRQACSASSFVCGAESATPVAEMAYSYFLAAARAAPSSQYPAPRGHRGSARLSLCPAFPPCLTSECETLLEGLELPRLCTAG